MAIAAPSVPGQQVIRANLSEAELIDLQRMADQDGISLDEAISTYGWQDSFAKLANSIEDKYPGDYAGAKITGAAKGSSWIAFKGEVPVEASEALRAFTGADVTAQAGRGFSAAEAEENLVAAFNAVAKREDLVRSATGSYDLLTGRVVIEVEPVDGLAVSDAARGQDLRQTLLDGISSELRSVGIDVVLRKSVDAEPHVGTAYGGGCVLFLPDTCPSSTGNPPHCTGGFSVRNSAGDRRMMNAGHCPQTGTTWSNLSGLGYYDVVNGPEHMGDYGDLQYFNVYDAAEEDDFYADWASTSRRDVAETRNAVVGQRICRFGRRTGAACSDVEETSRCVDYADYPPMCRLMRAEDESGGQGDSGGPWYYGNVAYGIHSGEVPTNAGLDTDSVFTPVRLSEEALNGAYVITQ